MPIMGGPIEKLELVTYAPSLLTSNDLEAGTKNIVAVAEPGAADYSSTLALTAPTDSRITVDSIAIRLQVTIDSYGAGANVLNYRVKRGGVSIGTGQLAAAKSTGAKYAVMNVTAGTLTGNSVLDVYLWTDHADGVVVSVCQLWLAVGNYNATWNGAKILSVAHTGTATVMLNMARQGTGVFDTFVAPKDPNPAWSQIYVVHSATGGFQNAASNLPKVHNAPGGIYLRVGNCTVATDLPYAAELGLILRSEQ